MTPLKQSFKATNSFKAGVRVRRYDRKFTAPAPRPKFMPRRRYFRKSKR